MERVKMPRQDRAKQFHPFEALGGLQSALRLKEYEHEKREKGEASDDAIAEICRVLSDLENGDLVSVKYFFDGWEHFVKGSSRVDAFEKLIEVDGKKICFDDILSIEKL